MNLQSLTPEDFLKIPLKRKWWILASLLVCEMLAVTAWMYFPKTYKSTAVVTIDSARVAKDYVKGLTTEARNYDDPWIIIMQQVTLALTKKTILLPVVEELKPYPELATAGDDALMKALRRSITVGRPKDNVGISVSYVHSDPHMAQAVAALLAEKLREENLKNREGVVENTAEFLAVELERVKVELEVKERAISEFKRAHLGELPTQMEANLRTLDRLQADMTNSSEMLNKLGERASSLEKAIKEYSDLGPAAVPYERDRRGGDFRPIDPRVTKLKDLRQKLAELQATYKESYPDIVYLKEEIRRLESMPAVDPTAPVVDEVPPVKGEEGMVVAKKVVDPYLRELMKERAEVKTEMAYLKEKHAQAAKQIREIEARIERTPTREQSLATLVRDYENMQKTYQNLLDKRTNAKMLENYESQQFGEQYRTIEPANFPMTAEPPTQLHFLLGGLILGCLVGFGSAIGVEITKSGFRRPEEAENYLGLPVIASIPAFSSATSGLGMIQTRALLTGPAGTAAPSAVESYLGQRGKVLGMRSKAESKLEVSKRLPPKFHLIAKWGPASLIAEQYRVAATRLVLMTAERKNAVTMVTSSVMGEGKTTTAVNLAYVLAHDLGKSTLLIDCDLKRPMIHEYAGVSAGPGLGDAAQGADVLENCLHRFEELPLWVLPAGSPRIRSIGLSGIQHLKKVLPTLRERYDHVILDAPPVLPLADVNVLSSMADMLLFVIKAGGTGQDIVKKALKSLGDAGEAGIILTQVEMEYAPYFMYAAPYANEDSRSRA